jgi:hypothetical protein
MVGQTSIRKSPSLHQGTDGGGGVSSRPFFHPSICRSVLFCHIRSHTIIIMPLPPRHVSSLKYSSNVAGSFVYWILPMSCSSSADGWTVFKDRECMRRTFLNDRFSGAVGIRIVWNRGQVLLALSIILRACSRQPFFSMTLRNDRLVPRFIDIERSYCAAPTNLRSTKL